MPKHDTVQMDETPTEPEEPEPEGEPKPDDDWQVGLAEIRNQGPPPSEPPPVPEEAPDPGPTHPEGWQDDLRKIRGGG